MIYNDVLNNKLYEILGKKEKYMNEDVIKVMDKGFDFEEALFITKSTSIYYDVEYCEWEQKSLEEFEDSLKVKGILI